MLPEERLEEALRAFDRRIQPVIDEYLERMGKHLREIGRLLPSDANRLVEMQRMNVNLKQIKRKIARAAEMSLADVEEAFWAAAEENARFAASYFTPEYDPAIWGNAHLERTLMAHIELTKSQLANLSQTTIQSKAYRNAVDVAVQAVNTGVEDYNSAIRRAVREAASEGLRVRYSESGRTKRLDSAVRQNVLDGVRALNQNIARQVGQVFGADGVEISAHTLCAEDHLPWQGKQMSIEDFKELQSSLPRPFGIWNCRHSWSYILLGISEPAWDQSVLEEYRKNSTEKVTIDGKERTRYEWTQQQRRIETAIRYQHDEITLAKASGDLQAVREAKNTIQALMKKYDQISEDAKLHKQPRRMAGYYLKKK